MSSLTSEAHPEPKFLKVTLFIKKLPHVTHEHFHNYWRKEHAEGAMFSGSLFAEKVLRYVQVWFSFIAFLVYFYVLLFVLAVSYS